MPFSWTMEGETGRSRCEDGELDDRLLEREERAVRISHGQGRLDDAGTIVGAARVIRPLNWGKNSTIVLTRADLDSIRPRQELKGDLDWISDSMMDAAAYAIAERARRKSDDGEDNDKAAGLGRAVRRQVFCIWQCPIIAATFQPM